MGKQNPNRDSDAGTRRRKRLRIGNSRRKADDVPGPSEDPATNLLLADVTIRAGSYILRRSVEKVFLTGRYGRETAREIVQNKSLGKSLMSFALAKIATRSLPGAIIVGGGAIAKTLYDRRKGKRKAQREGGRKLPAPARDS